jgi:ribosomal protein L11 methyltransferase
MGRYLQLTVELPEEAAELASATLHELGALGLEVRESGRTLPGVAGPPPGDALLIGYFDARPKAAKARKRLEAEFPKARTSLDAVEDQDWSNAWKARVKSVTVGRLWVGPPWEAEQAPKPLTRVVVEPKMAFGTGDHATTQLCLEAVDEFLHAHPGASVLDVGTGTGVLAIASRKLGASRVVGVDNDPMSVELAKECAASNGVPELELSGRTLDRIEGRFDLVLANILANTLVELAPRIAPRVGIRLVLAGVLVHQAPEVSRAYEALGLAPAATKALGDWIRLEFRRD